MLNYRLNIKKYQLIAIQSKDYLVFFKIKYRMVQGIVQLG